MILDGAFVAQMLSPRTLNTFQEYSNSVFWPYSFGQLQRVRRLDIVWDVYLADSLKARTKSKRGQGQRRKVLPLAPLPSTWKSFLKNDENKITCFAFFPKKLKELQFLAKYSSSLAVTALSHHLIIHRSRPEPYEWIHPRTGRHTSISSCCRRK